MPKCPRVDCKLSLRESEFAAPGSWECPKHGGPIWFQDEIQLAVEEESESEPTDLHFFINRFAAWALRYTVDQDLSGTLPTVVTVENMPPDEIDVQFEFDTKTGSWLGIKSYIDKRSTF